MKQKDIRKLIDLAKLATNLRTAGENHAADTILAEISHIIADNLERKANGESPDSSA